MASHLETNPEALPTIVGAVSQFTGTDLQSKAEPLVKKQKYVELLELISEQFELLAEKASGPEIEMILQILCSLAKGDKEASKDTFTNLAKKITEKTEPRAELRIKVLSAILNELTHSHAEFFDIFVTALEYSYTVGSKNFGPRLSKNITLLMDTWGFSFAQKRTVYALLADIHTKAGKEAKSYQFLVAYLNASTDIASDPKVQERAATTIRLAFKQEIYQFSDLLRIPAIASLKGSSEYGNLFQLVQLAVEGTYKDLVAFGNEEFVQSVSPSIPDKFRIFTITSLAERQNRITYKDIADAIQVDMSQVEDFVIKAIGAGVVKGKLNQLKEEAVIEQVTKRSMTQDDWKFIQSNLERWSDSVASALATVKHARHE